MALKREDKALLVAALLGILSTLGGVFQGDARFATLGGLLVGFGAVLKATLKD